MDLKVGNVVEFKKYEDMTEDERVQIGKEFFPSSGKVKEINVNDCDGYFLIIGSPYVFCEGSVARVISDVDDVDVNSLKLGDEVLMKATIRKISGNHVSISWVNNNKGDVVKVLKHKEPERFIVQEKCYGFYIGVSGDLVSNKDRAQVYADRDAAYQEATDMNINLYDVIPYDD